jgi:hypothetical protein
MDMAQAKLGHSLVGGNMKCVNQKIKICMMTKFDTSGRHFEKLLRTRKGQTAVEPGGHARTANTS